MAHVNKSVEEQKLNESNSSLLKLKESSDESLKISSGYGRGKSRRPPLPTVIGVEHGFGRAYVVRQRMLKQQQLEQQQQQSIGAKQDSSSNEEKPVQVSPDVVPKPELVDGPLAMYLKNAKIKPSRKNRH